MTANLPRSRPVVVWMSILAGLQVMSAGSALADVAPAKWCALFSLGVAAAQAGIQFYVQAQVTPWETVIAKENADGLAVAGPASELPTGTIVEEPRQDAGHADAGGLIYLAIGLVVLLVILRVFHLI